MYLSPAIFMQIYLFYLIYINIGV